MQTQERHREGDGKTSEHWPEKETGEPANVRWYKHDSTKKHPVTQNVHVLLDAPFENTMACMIDRTVYDRKHARHRILEWRV